MSLFHIPVLIFYIFVLLSLFISQVLAKIEVYDYPSKININQDFEVGVSLSNLTDPNHFLSVALHQKSGDPYFGLTRNSEGWWEADDDNCKNFPQVSVNEGSWSGKLTAKVTYGEKDFTNILGSYILKIIKYTDSCNKSYSDEFNVELYDPNPPPTATPTNIPTIIPTLTVAPSSTPKPTHTSTPTKTSATITKSVNSSSTPVPTLLSGLVKLSSLPTSQVLGEESESTSASSSEVIDTFSSSTNSSHLQSSSKKATGINFFTRQILAGILLALAGVSFLVSALIIFRRQQKTHLSEKEV